MTQPAAPPPATRTLSRERIVAAALALVDEEGPSGLTMRVLGQRLGVTATALYHYFDGRHALLEALVDQVCADIVGSIPPGGTPLERVRSLLVALVTESSAHPTTAAWAITTYARRGPMLRIHEALLAELAACGISVEAAVVAKGALLRFAVGHLVLQEAAPGREWQTLSRREFPHTRAAGPATNRTPPQRVFTVGLDALLAGLGLGPPA